MGLRPLPETPSFVQARASDRITAYLRDLIMSGQLHAGDHLRVEQLAKQLHISVTPIRESLLALHAEGFVDRLPRRGYVVANLSRQDVLDLFWVQSSLAGELAARAAQAITDERLAELAHLQGRLEAAADRADYDAISDLNHQIHRAINLTTRSPKIVGYLRQASRYAPRWAWRSIEGWPAVSVDHYGILDALERRDPAAARAEVSRHIAIAGDLLAEHLAQNGFWDEREGDVSPGPRPAQ